ncbi:transcriptional regulator [Methylobacterium sp. J-070]|uniref:transcriptional regulator n=1 Tax=Methylobacterium sp. J-070 TaxID=2836650 RepID=UPI001FBB8095|nr:transcriptional regulator [Methylobacterium sp. J-070]MCJ2048794.1 transcriptional regulator [Methylobacterium sp. J-070]
MNTQDVRALLRQRVEEAGGATGWARRHAVSSVYVQDCVSGHRAPGPAILVGLGLRKIASEARYEEIRQ